MGALENGVGYFLRRPDGSIVEIGPIVPPTAPDEPDPTKLINEDGAEVDTEGTSEDGSHLFFTMRVGRWPSDSTGVGAPSLYEYAGTGNTTPMLVGVDHLRSARCWCHLNWARWQPRRRRRRARRARRARKPSATASAGRALTRSAAARGGVASGVRGLPRGPRSSTCSGLSSWPSCESPPGTGSSETAIAPSMGARDGLEWLPGALGLDI